MQFMHALTTAVLIATFTLVGAVTSTNDTSIPSTLTIKEGIDPPTATPTASSINVTVSMTPNAYPTPTPDPGSNTTKSCDPCYCDGEKWDQLGSWQTLKNALMNSGVVRVTTIPGGYHVNEDIRVKQHCYVFEIGVNKGIASDLNPDKITQLLNLAHKKCSRGGHWNLKFVADDGDIMGLGWFKADPQKNADCS